MDDLATTQEVLVGTKNGKPIAELRPYSGGKVDSPFGLHRDLRVIGDIATPIAEGDAHDTSGGGSPSEPAA